MEPTLLTPQHRQILSCIAHDTYLNQTFYFTGGTALSEVYFHHRYSEDLDFFSENEFTLRPLEISIQAIKSTTSPAMVEQQSLNGQQTYWFHFDSQVIKVDFAYFPFEHMGDFYKMLEFSNLKVASLLDLCINKIQAITSRKRGRDFLDLFMIMNKLKLPISELLLSYRLKFDVSLSTMELAKHFLSVSDAVDQPKFLGEVRWSEIETFFIDQARELKPNLKL